MNGSERAVAQPLQERTCLVTGATSGIGLETAAALASAGATVLLAGPDVGSAEQACAAVRERFPNARCQPFGADLSRTDQVRALADAVRSEHRRLDVLVNNAGIYATGLQRTADGFEATLAVNFLAPFLLTSLLMPALAQASQARVINVGSLAHRTGRIDFEDPHFERRRYHGYLAYAASKLALVCSTFAMARHCEGSVICNVADPGVVGTGLVRSAGWPGRMLAWAMPVLRAPSRGAMAAVRLVVDPALAGITGGYFGVSGPKRPSAAARSRALAREVWALGQSLTGATWPSPPDSGNAEAPTSPGIAAAHGQRRQSPG